jgi:hypothetical protein
MDEGPTVDQVRAVVDERFGEGTFVRLRETQVRAATFAEIERHLASPIQGITIGPVLEGKINEQEALDLVNASRLCMLAGVRSLREKRDG